MNDRTIALIALAVSVAVGLWTIAQYLLEGARVRVRMNAAVLDEYAIRRSVKSWTTVEHMARLEGGWYIEAVEIEIENVSRSALTVSDVSLDLGRTRRFGLGRRTIGPYPLSAPDATQERSTRLEPFARCSYVFDVWRALRAVEKDKFAAVQFPVRVRASVRVAGRIRRRRSPLRRGWVVAPGQMTFFSGPTEIGLAAWQSLFRHLPRDEEGRLHHSAVGTALAIRDTFPVSGKAPSREQIEALLKKNTFSGSDEQRLYVTFASWDVARDLEPLYNEPADPERSSKAPDPSASVVPERRAGQADSGHKETRRPRT